MQDAIHDYILTQFLDNTDYVRVISVFMLATILPKARLVHVCTVCSTLFNPESTIQIIHPWGHELRYPSAMVAGPLRLLRWLVWSCWWRVVSPVFEILMSLAPKIGGQSVRVLGRSFHVAEFVWVLLKCFRLFKHSSIAVPNPDCLFEL